MTRWFRIVATILPVISLMAGCKGNGIEVTKKINPQNGHPEFVVDRGVQHASLFLDPLPDMTVRATFWELDSLHQQPPLRATGELLQAGLEALLREAPQSPFFYFLVEPLPEYWKQVAEASLQSPDWKVALKTNRHNDAARKVVEEADAHRVWADAWKSNGYTMKLEQLEKVQICPDPNNPKVKSLCGALIAFKATRDRF